MSTCPFRALELDHARRNASSNARAFQLRASLSRTPEQAQANQERASFWTAKASALA